MSETPDPVEREKSQLQTELGRLKTIYQLALAKSRPSDAFRVHKEIVKLKRDLSQYDSHEYCTNRRILLSV